MTLAMFRVMALELLRDRAALLMAFLLPPIVFLIFSTVFAGTTNAEVKLKVAVADLAKTPASQALDKALIADPSLRGEAATPASLAEVRRRVRAGLVDAGVVIRGDPAAPGSPILILADPTRAIAAPLTEARTRAALLRAAPQALLKRTLSDLSPAIGPLTADQKANVDIAEQSLTDDPTSAPKTADLFAQEEVIGSNRGGGSVAYYAGGVTILFALFAAMNRALSLIDERQAGIADRILAGPSGMGPVVSGKFLFLAAQAAAQAVAVFAVAQLIYQAPVTQHLALWLATTGAMAICAAGLALGLVAVCRTREQAQMLSTFVILVLAAVGGSMVPRFLMPPWLQQLGWFTPHAWVIDAYQGVLWRDAGPQVLYRAWLVLALIGGLGLLVALTTARRAAR
ncbi:MAG: ABC transporter permease [Caulobacterales bacterium]